MRSFFKRVFWRTYFHGLALIIASVVSVAAITFFTHPLEQGFLGRTEHTLPLLANGLICDLTHPEKLELTLERITLALNRAAAIYTHQGQWLAGSGDRPPPALDPSNLVKIGGSSPIKGKDGRLVFAIALEGEASPYLLVEGIPSVKKFFLWAVLAIMIAWVLVSWPVAKAIARPYEKVIATSRILAKGDLTARTGISRRDEVGELARALDEMATHLEEHHHIEKEFVANISHEIRTPLARLRVALELFEDTPKDTQHNVEHLLGMRSDITELEHFLDNVITSVRLDFAAGKIKKLPFQKKEVAVDDFFNQVIARFYRYHPDRRLEFINSTHLSTFRIIPEMLLRVFDNLLANAVKYSPSESPILLTMDQDEHEHRLNVRIIDFGVGIPEADLPYVFNPFFRSDRSRSRHTGGTGLGLTICQRIIAVLHGGTITAQLNQEKGMTFAFELPLETPSTPSS